MRQVLRWGLSVAALTIAGEHSAFAQFTCPTTHEIAIQQALDAAAPSGGVVQFGVGTYDTCDTVKPGALGTRHALNLRAGSRAACPERRR